MISGIYLYGFTWIMSSVNKQILTRKIKEEKLSQQTGKPWRVSLSQILPNDNTTLYQKDWSSNL